MLGAAATALGRLRQRLNPGAVRTCSGLPLTSGWRQQETLGMATPGRRSSSLFGESHRNTRNHVHLPPVGLGTERYDRESRDRKSTRLNSITNAHLVCRLLLEQKKTSYNTYL